MIKKIALNWLKEIFLYKRGLDAFEVYHQQYLIKTICHHMLVLEALNVQLFHLFFQFN